MAERPDSDVDLIVEFGGPTGFVELVRLERLLAESFGRPVDLTTEPGLDRYIRDAVVSSASVFSMPLPDVVYLRHVLDAIQWLEEYAARVIRDQFDQDPNPM